MKCPICNKTEIGEDEAWCQECERAKYLNPSMPFMNDPEWFESFDINKLCYQYAVNIFVELILGRPRGFQQYFMSNFLKYLTELLHTGKSDREDKIWEFLSEHHMDISAFQFMVNMCKELTIDASHDVREMFLQRFVVNAVEVLIKKEKNGEVRRGMWDTRRDERTFRKPGNVS